MNFQVSLTTAQLRALWRWAHVSLDTTAYADVLLDSLPDGAVRVGQGDSRATITIDGRIVEED
jgi:hypothetical protein